MKALTIKHERTGLSLWDDQTLILASKSHYLHSVRLAALEKAASYDDIRIIYQRPCDIGRTAPVTMLVKKASYRYFAGAWAA